MLKRKKHLTDFLIMTDSGEGRSPGMPDIPHKAAENTGALFFPCDLRASVRDHKKKILIISDYDGFRGWPQSRYARYPAQSS